MFQNYQIAYYRKHVRMREVEPLSFLRQCVAYTLSQSARRIPHAAGIAHFDATNLVEYGKNRDKSIAETEEGLSDKALFRRAIHRNFSAFFIKSFAHALHREPAVNAVLDYSRWGGDGTLYRAEDVNISFTVHTKFGVIKPIIRNPHQKDIETVAREMRDLARRARRTDANELYSRVARAYLGCAVRELDLSGIGALWIWLRHVMRPRHPLDPDLKDTPEEKKLKPSEVMGATCTVANIGMMMSGHQTVTVIIPPEVMMFGIGDVHVAPGMHEGKVVPRYIVTMAGTMDHRAMDAGEAFPVYGHIKRYTENPALIYEWQPGDDI